MIITKLKVNLSNSPNALTNLTENVVIQIGHDVVQISLN